MILAGINDIPIENMRTEIIPSAVFSIAAVLLVYKNGARVTLISAESSLVSFLKMA